MAIQNIYKRKNAQLKLIFSVFFFTFLSIFTIMPMFKNNSTIKKFIPEKILENLIYTKDINKYIRIEVNINQENKISNVVHKTFQKVYNKILKKKDVEVTNVEFDRIFLKITTNHDISNTIHSFKEVEYEKKIEQNAQSKSYTYIIKIHRNFLNNYINQMYEKNKNVLEKRLDIKNTHDVEVRKQGENSIIVHTQESSSIEEIFSQITSKGKFAIHVLQYQDNESNDMNIKKITNVDGNVLTLQKKPILLNSDVKSVNIREHEGSKLLVLFLKTNGIKNLSELAKSNKNAILVCLFDNQVFSITNISNSLQGNVFYTEIKKETNVETIQKVHNALKFGYLPTNNTIVTHSYLKPLLGENIICSLRKVFCLIVLVLTLILVLLFKIHGVFIMLSCVFTVELMLLFMKIFSIAFGLFAIMGMFVGFVLCLLVSLAIAMSIKNLIKKNKNTLYGAATCYEGKLITIVYFYILLFLIDICIYCFSGYRFQNLSVILFFSFVSSFFSSTFFRNSLYYSYLFNRKNNIEFSNIV